MDFSKVLVEIQESMLALNRAQGKTQATVIKIDQGVNNWRPQVEEAMQELREEVGKLRQKADFLGKTKMASPSASSPRVPLIDEERKAPLLPTPPSPTKLMTAAEEAEKWAYGHRFAQHHRGRASVMVTTLIPTPGKGKFEVTPVSMNSLGNFDSGGGKFDGDPDERQYNHRVPKLDFPKFDGSDPQDWRMRCEHYFDVNNTYPGLWVRVATIYFIG